MQVVLAVIDDLFRFATSSLFGVFSVSSNEKAKSHINIKFNDISRIPHTPTLSDVSESIELFTHGGKYFIGGLETYLYNDPVISFDNAYTQLKYGSKVTLIKFGGRWAQVRVGTQDGWVLKDLLHDHVKEVFPHFIENVIYDAQHQETAKLRFCIDDQFGCARAGISLTSSEYVIYRLQNKKQFISWSEERPRIPGTWRRKLRGRTGIHIGVVPKTDSIMEYIIDNIGYVAYVDAVFPDESIKINSVGLYSEGKYSEEVMTHEQWRELGPVFIDVR